jgi:hypothetical protein
VNAADEYVNSDDQSRAIAENKKEPVIADRLFLIVRVSWVLFGAVYDAAFAKVIRGKFNSDLITGHDSYIMLAHFSGNMGNDNVAIFELNTKHCVGKGFENCSFHLYSVFFCHVLTDLCITRIAESVVIIVNSELSASTLGQFGP